MENIAVPLLAWFYQNRRLLPFRQEPSPYHIWVSEIMLQQTRMTAAVPYYERFIAALPDAAALAGCEPEHLHKLWQGLGYYNRAANMQKAARIVCGQYGGSLPADYEALRALPGIGDYTAGAIASIGFGLPVPAVDGNVLRVFARLCNDDADITRPQTKARFTELDLGCQPPQAPGDYNQALMELGALVCLPNGEPLCGQCPLAAQCAGRAAGRQAALPVKPPKQERPQIPVTVALVRSPAGLLLQKRPAKGLLAGLWQPLAFEGLALDCDALFAALCKLGVDSVPLKKLPPARHVFTHRVWKLNGWAFSASAVPLPEGYVWADDTQLADHYAVPSAFAAYVGLGVIHS
jgi:A/G-specific adenine glycosylase